MHPVLLRLGPLVLPTYGFFMALGFTTAFIVSAWRARREGLDQEAVGDLFLVIVLSAVVGARATYVLVHLDRFRADPLSAFFFWRGGLVFFGGLVLAFAASIVYCRRSGLPVAATADLLAPQMALGHFFGRLGCFSFGCCYGKACSLPWAVVFPGDPAGTPRHPTQLYEAAAELVFFYVLWKLYERRPPRGTVAAAYVFLYSCFRFMVEFVRGDDRGGSVLLGLSLSQATAMVLAPAAVLFIVFRLLTARSGAGDGGRPGAVAGPERRT